MKVLFIFEDNSAASNLIHDMKVKIKAITALRFEEVSEFSSVTQGIEVAFVTTKSKNIQKFEHERLLYPAHLALSYVPESDNFKVIKDVRNFVRDISIADVFTTIAVYYSYERMDVTIREKQKQREAVLAEFKSKFVELRIERDQSDLFMQMCDLMEKLGKE